MQIMVLDGHTTNPGDPSWAPLERLGSLTVFDRTPAAEVVARARGADVVLTNKTPLPADVIANLPADPPGPSAPNSSSARCATIWPMKLVAPKR